jgi:TonB-linked SusC/RagA family outer membrane protein
LLYSDVPAASSPIVDGLSMPNSRLTEQYTKGSSYQAIFTLNYAKTIGKHSVNMMVGGDRAEGNDQSARFYYTGQQISNIDETWAFDQNTFTQQGIAAGENIKQSFLSRLSYDFNKRYFVDAIARYDASTRFAADQVWGLSYNVGLGWNIAEENFFKNNVSFVNSLRLKVNYGVTGDDRVGGSGRLWQEQYKVDLVNGGYLYGENMVSSLNPGQYPNPNITWEKARSWNVGFESSMFNNKLDVNIQAFHRENYDAFDAFNLASVPQYAGFIPPAINYAEFIADGLEFSLGYRGNIVRDLRFNANVNFGFSSGYQSKGMNNPFQLFENTPEDWQYQVGTNSRVYNSSNFGLRANGMLKTQADVDALLAQYPNYTLFGVIPERGWLYYEDANGDGKINERDYVPMFNRPSPFSTGITLGFSYKSLALNTNIAANFGGKVYYDSESMKAPTTTANVDAFWKDHWSPENPNGLFPRSDDPSLGKRSTFWAVDGTMIRINNMTLSYSLPKKYLSKVGFSNARILATGNNLWTIVNPFKYKDPYTSSVIDYPTLRTLSVGLSLGL